MVRTFDLPDDPGLPRASSPDRQAPQTLKEACYVVATVDENALKIWAEIWKELQIGGNPPGSAPPANHDVFRPSSGWPAFLEKLWLLKHYLDYIHRFCREADPDNPAFSNNPALPKRHEENP